MSASISRDEWLKALHDAGYRDDEDDPNAVTVAEFAAMFGLTRTVAERRLKALEERGTATRTAKRGAGKDGRIMRLLAYRLQAEKPRKRA